MTRLDSRYAVLGAVGLILTAAAAEPVTPGSVGESLKKPPELRPPPPAPVLQPPPRKAAGVPASSKQFVVQRIAFVGNQQYSEAELAPLVAEFLNRPITIAQLYEATDKVSEFYARNGYALASVSVPPQSITQGTVQLKIIEGRIGQISFEGNKRYSAEVLGEFMPATAVGKAYRAGTLERDLQNLNTLPGLATRGVLKPGAEYGTTDVVVKVSETRAEASLSADNYGRKDVGEYRYSAYLNLFNPLGVADQLQFLALHSSTNRLNYGYIAYSLPVNNQGARFNASYGWAHFTVAPPQEVSGDNRNAEVFFEIPVVRNGASTLTTSIGASQTDARANLAAPGGSLPVSQTSITIFDIAGTLRHTWPGGAVSQQVLTLRSNFRGAVPAQRDHGEPLRLELDSQHLQPLPIGVQLLARLNAVYSPEPLPDTEQFSLGGPGTLRGFPPSEARGDRGLFGSVTLQRALVAGPVTLVPRVFIDTGTATKLDSPSAGKHENESLSSAGLGLSSYFRSMTLKLDWSYPLDSRPVSDGRNEGRLYGALSVNF